MRCVMLLVFGSLLLEKLERWLQLMLKWSPQERGKDPEATPSDCFSQLAVILQLKVNWVILFLLSLSPMWACCLFVLLDWCWQNSRKDEVCKWRLQSLNFDGILMDCTHIYLFSLQCAWFFFFPSAGSCPEHDVCKNPNILSVRRWDCGRPATEDRKGHQHLCSRSGAAARGGVSLGASWTGHTVCRRLHSNI